MKALVYLGPEQIEYTDALEPIPLDGEVIVRIESVGICGSDMHAYLGHDERRPAPLILGHEAAGTVVTGSNTGKRVAINPLVSCGECNYCLNGRENLCPNRQIISMQPREGAFAEYVAIPESNLVEVPESIDLDKAALTEPIACGWHAARLANERLHGDLNSAEALVIGGGAIGIGAALSLTANGVSNVLLAERNPSRVEYLKGLAEFDVVSTDEIPTERQFDLVIDGVGVGATRKLASQRTAAGGLIVGIGLGDNIDGLDVRRCTLQEIGFLGSYTYTQNDFRMTARAIFDGRLGRLLWTRTRGLSEGQRAFKDILDVQEEAPKVILKPNH